MNASDVLDHAREILERPDAIGKGLWQRTAAFLARQALELSLADFWKARVPAMAQCSARAQLLALSHYTSDEKMGPRVSYTWRALSRACHHRAYELSPTAGQLTRWLESVQWFVETTQPVS